MHDSTRTPNARYLGSIAETCTSIWSLGSFKAKKKTKLQFYLKMHVLVTFSGFRVIIELIMAF